jgi:hypothetical protein
MSLIAAFADARLGVEYCFFSQLTMHDYGLNTVSPHNRRCAITGGIPFLLTIDDACLRVEYRFFSQLTMPD